MDSGTLANGALETISPDFFIPLPPSNLRPLRGTFPMRERLCVGDSGTLTNAVLAFCANKNRSARMGFAERFPVLLFHGHGLDRKSVV